MRDDRGAPPRVEAIDGLRGIAALSVAWFHLYGQNGGPPLAEAMPAALNVASVWGRFGVQLFFGISGFVVAYTLLNDRSIGRARDVGTYFIRRSVRLDPTYWLALAAYVIGVPLIIKLGGPADVFPSQRLDVSDIVANVLYFLPLNTLLYVPVAWSLVVEIQFYLFFALLVVALNRLEKRGWDRNGVFFWLGTLLMLVAAAPMLRSGPPAPNLYEYLYQFLGGIFAAAAYLRVPRAPLLWGLHVVLMIAAFALSSMAEAATPTKTRHRTKHSSRVSSGAASATATKPAAKKKPAPPRPKASASTTTTTKKAPAKRRPSTKPR
jgi:peptidoglycan/LPS O-acetylase OafA/YrhL